MLTLLHTSDWHLGQTLRDQDRDAEHHAFLDWLANLLEARWKSERPIHGLLIAGDIFDGPNPSARAQALFYRFIERVRQVTRVVITAGNHDSGERLAAPSPLFDSLGVTVVGAWPGESPECWNNMLCPIEGFGESALVLAMPFLRLSDLGSFTSEQAETHFIDAHRHRFEQLVRHARSHAALRRQDLCSLVAMGHCYVAGTSVNEDTERRIGNQDQLPADIFPPELSYVALGHLHKMQKVAGTEHIRYSGSVIPLGFSEVEYKHSVLEVTIDRGCFISAEPIEIPRSRDFLILPATHRPWEEVEPLLLALPLRGERRSDSTLRPLLEVRILLPAEGIADLRDKVQRTLSDKWPQLFRIDAQSLAQDSASAWETESRGLSDMKVLDVFQALCTEKNLQCENHPTLMEDFRTLLESVQEGRPL